MVQCSPSGTVSVIVGGEPLHEYQVEEKSEGDVRTYTCYIEAKEGDEYQVNFAGFPLFKQGKIQAKIFIDTKLADFRSYCTNDNDQRQTPSLNHYISGFLVKQEAEVRTIKKFAFGRLQTTNDADAKRLTLEEQEDLCSIRVVISRHKRTGRMKHGKLNIKSPTLPMNHVVHEDSKPAQWGLSTRAGQTKTEELLSNCNCKMEMGPSFEEIVVIFKYLPYERLVVKGFIDRARIENNNSDDEADTPKTDGRVPPLSRRRGREEEASVPRRNVRVKTEGQARAEALDKEERRLRLEGERLKLDEERLKLEEKKIQLAEEKMKLERQKLELEETRVKQEEEKEAETLDLTDEGEFVLPSRQIGDTIIIDDD